MVSGACRQGGAGTLIKPVEKGDFWGGHRKVFEGATPGRVLAQDPGGAPVGSAPGTSP